MLTKAPTREQSETCTPLRRCGVCVECRAESAAKARHEQRLCAWRFLTGDETLHPEECIFGESCSRLYDPLPVREALPPDLRMYEGTGIGALYGLRDSEGFAWELAGWTVERRN